MEDRELNQARLKPNPVDQPVKLLVPLCKITYLLPLYTILQYSTKTVLLIFPFLQTNITSQMWLSGGDEGLSFSQSMFTFLAHNMFMQLYQLYKNGTLKHLIT